MSRQNPVSTIMTTDVLSFRPEDNVAEAMNELITRGIDGAPVIDADRKVVGVISTGDMIVQETRLHVPTVISLLGATFELPGEKRHFEEDLRKALGSSVGEVMEGDPITIGPDETIEAAATTLHDRGVSRLPVVGPDGLVGIVARADILRAIIAEASGEAPAPDA